MALASPQFTPPPPPPKKSFLGIYIYSKGHWPYQEKKKKKKNYPFSLAPKRKVPIWSCLKKKTTNFSLYLGTSDYKKGKKKRKKKVLVHYMMPKKKILIIKKKNCFGTVS
jgi:hypothetical protein